MKDHEIIIKMLSKVTPDDTDKLDEIDCRCQAFLYDFDNYTVDSYDKKNKILTLSLCGELVGVKSFHQYTRSRDALKAIRPDWAVIHIFKAGSHCTCYIDGKEGGENHGSSWDDFETEELAELNAIIHAIAYERAQK
jgi:hypothetical protein